MQNLHPKLSLIEHFKDLPDPRVNRTKDHDLIDLLVIAICTLLCAGESFNDMADFGTAKADWFKTFLRLRNGIPSHDTFNRLVRGAGPAGLSGLFCALDAKFARGGRANARRSEPGARRLRRRESGHAPAAGVEPVETRENQEAGIKGKQLNASWNHAYLLRLLGITT